MFVSQQCKGMDDMTVESSLLVSSVISQSTICGQFNFPLAIITRVRHINGESGWLVGLMLWFWETDYVSEKMNSCGCRNTLVPKFIVVLVDGKMGINSQIPFKHSDDKLCLIRAFARDTINLWVSEMICNLGFRIELLPLNAGRLCNS